MNYADAKDIASKVLQLFEIEGAKAGGALVAAMARIMGKEIEALGGE